MTISVKSVPGLRNRNGLRQELTGGGGRGEEEKRSKGQKAGLKSRKVLGNEVKEMWRGLHVGT